MGREAFAGTNQELSIVEKGRFWDRVGVGDDEAALRIVEEEEGLGSFPIANVGVYLTAT